MSMSGKASPHHALIEHGVDQVNDGIRASENFRKIFHISGIYDTGSNPRTGNFGADPVQQLFITVSEYDFLGYLFFTRARLFRHP